VVSVGSEARGVDDSSSFGALVCGSREGEASSICIFVDIDASAAESPEVASPVEAASGFVVVFCSTTDDCVGVVSGLEAPLASLIETSAVRDVAALATSEEVMSVLFESGVGVASTMTCSCVSDAAVVTAAGSDSTWAGVDDSTSMFVLAESLFESSADVEVDFKGPCVNSFDASVSAIGTSSVGDAASVARLSVPSAAETELAVEESVFIA
jgi:hypothetical protein